MIDTLEEVMSEMLLAENLEKIPNGHIPIIDRHEK